MADDAELQNFAKGYAAVTQLRGFPQSSRPSVLAKLLAHLMFQATVRHHAMNGVNTWETMAAPYSNLELWKALPTTKLVANETRSVLEYSTPKRFVPQLVVLSTKFDYVVPESESMAAIFQAPTFKQKPRLKSVLWEFDEALEVIDAIIPTRE